MNEVIIECVIGTNMGTRELNLEKYLNLWKRFEYSLEKEELNLSSFSKKWEKYGGGYEDYHKFYDKLKKQNARKGKLKDVQLQSITQVEKYIKFLDKDFIKQELYKDEGYDFWSD